MGIPHLYPFMDGLFQRKYLDMDDLGVAPFQETIKHLWVSEIGVTKKQFFHRKFHRSNNGKH